MFISVSLKLIFDLSLSLIDVLVPLDLRVARQNRPSFDVTLLFCDYSF